MWDSLPFGLAAKLCQQPSDALPAAKKCRLVSHRSAPYGTRGVCPALPMTMRGLRPYGLQSAVNSLVKVGIAKGNRFNQTIKYCIEIHDLIGNAYGISPQ